MQIKAIIHDWDDTVTKSFKTYSVWYWDVAKTYNLPEPNIDSIKKYWGNTVTTIMQGVWPQLNSTKAQNIMEEYARTTEKTYELELFDNVASTIFELTKNNFTLGIISSGNKNAITSNYKRLISPHKLLHLFIHSHEDCPVYKPNPAVFDKGMALLRQKGISESETIYVGDSINDLKAAKNRGLDFIATTTGVNTKEEFLEHALAEDKILDSFADLTNYLNTTK